MCTRRCPGTGDGASSTQTPTSSGGHEGRIRGDGKLFVILLSSSIIPNTVMSSGGRSQPIPSALLYVQEHCLKITGKTRAVPLSSGT
jgi:hypothetical protein